MRQVLLHYTTLVWLILVSLTGLSWWLSTQDGQSMAPAAIATSTMMVVAFIKVRLVGLHFMELRHAPLPLRLVFEAWVIAVCGLILFLYWQ